MTFEERDVFRARINTAGSLEEVNTVLDELHEIAKHEPDGGAHYVIGYANAILQMDYGILNPLGPRPA